jgi:hypothetical protein
MARPRSRLLRTRPRRTLPVLADTAGNNTDNGNACDIVDGRVAESALDVKFQLPKRHGTRRLGDTEIRTL